MGQNIAHGVGGGAKFRGYQHQKKITHLDGFMKCIFRCMNNFRIGHVKVKVPSCYPFLTPSCCPFSLALSYHLVVAWSCLFSCPLMLPLLLPSLPLLVTPIVIPSVTLDHHAFFVPPNVAPSSPFLAPSCHCNCHPFCYPRPSYLFRAP